MEKKGVLPDWLPAGWKVESRKRKNGRKIKWYTNPSKELKFFSKPEVLRYLSSTSSNLPNTKEMEKKGTEKFSTEKAAPEGLPPGWIKEMKVSKKGNKIRKDPSYIDPVSGQTFRSMREVSRFLETGGSGKLESKPGDQGPSTVELGESLSSLPAKAEKHILTDNYASGKEVNANQKLKLGAAHMAHYSCTEDSASSFGGLGGVLPKKGKKEDDHSDDTIVSDPAGGRNQEKSPGDDDTIVSDPSSGRDQEKPPGDGVEKHEKKQIQRKRKILHDRSRTNLPRRASKRLAGIVADTSLEMQTNNQAHLALVRKEGETQAATIGNPGNFSNKNEHEHEHVTTPVTGVTIRDKVQTRSTTGKRQQDPVTLPLPKLPSPAKPTKTVIASCEGDKTCESALESSLSDLWTDPCIEFAIKTLTGTIPDINEKKVNEVPSSCISEPSLKSPPSTGLPCDEIWKDPCFMFAVKTLTGEIPIMEDLCSQKIVQQQSSSSANQETSGLALPNTRVEEFGQAKVSQLGTPEKAMYKQQPGIAPNVYQNCCSQNSVRIGLHQSVDKQRLF